MTAWLFVTVLLLILMVGLFVVQRDIRKRTSPRDLMRVPFGMQSVECGACGVIQAASIEGHVFICFSCSRANRLPVDDIRPDMSPVLVTVEGPLRKFKFKREGHNYFHETERLEMTAAEEAAHKGTPHSGVVEATVSGDLEQPTGPPGEVAHLDESNGEPHGEVVGDRPMSSTPRSGGNVLMVLGPAVYGKTYSQNSNRSENSITSHVSIRSNVGLPMCVVCLDAIGNVVLLPCAHGGICEGCATKIAQNHRAGGGKCPHCRTSIDTLVNLKEINGDVATGVEIRVPIAQAR
eukprot:CAMPEP_0194496660 /NCGR_PEP_ID=MMETSP0253-20130528/13859_1 /TAXON_ID=2966 /ORGANISM="Noctiluca scintillans" /LENGTH=291 /DNA_ID=CAMNT_0039338085 /DNA_START=116 /DNA_END=988 /DNA_ORIENTATION=-